MSQRRAAAEFVTAFSTGWPEKDPHLMIVSLTTATGERDFALSKDQALLIAKTIQETAAHLATPGVTAKPERRR
jgi:hypothetical protein